MLTLLELSNNVIGNVGADALAKGLKESPTLTEVRLDGNFIDEVIAAAIEDALK